MHVINARNVNDAYDQGIHMLASHFKLDGQHGSRVGDVIEMDAPVTTVYNRPTERVLWDAQRDCNPFFHLFESFWMLAGRNDVKFLTHFNKKMADYSDDGTLLSGAYGHRWRNYFDRDQLIGLHGVVNMLKHDRETRRCVLAMWDGHEDLTLAGAKDIPCNLSIKFEARRGVLDMMIFNRSNDAIFGAYGANAVHMSVLQEWVAACVGIPVGRYWQISGNFHAYADVWGAKVRKDLFVDEDLYTMMQGPDVLPLVGDEEEPVNFLRACENLCANISAPCAELYGFHFLDTVAAPLAAVWNAWKANDRGRALALVARLPQNVDWVMACRMWMERRALK